MALSTMANLKLGQLGHIAGGNANITTQTSLAVTCRGASSTTKMRDDFRIGGVSVTNTFVSGDVGISKGEFGIRFKGDVGEYMGATGGNELVEEGQLTTGIDANNWMADIEAVEGGVVGSLYQDRIANRSTNSSDYEGYFNRTHGDVIINFNQPHTAKDKLRASAV